MGRAGRPPLPMRGLKGPVFQHPRAQRAGDRCRAALGNAWGTGSGLPWVDPTPRHASRGPNPTVGLRYGAQRPAWTGDGGRGHRRAMVSRRRATRLLLRWGRMGKEGLRRQLQPLRGRRRGRKEQSSVLWLMSNAGSSELAEPQLAGSSAGGGKGLSAQRAWPLLKSYLRSEPHSCSICTAHVGSEQVFHSRGEASKRQWGPRGTTNSSPARSPIKPGCPLHLFSP